MNALLGLDCASVALLDSMIEEGGVICQTALSLTAELEEESIVKLYKVGYGSSEMLKKKGKADFDFARRKRERQMRLF